MADEFTCTINSQRLNDQIAALREALIGSGQMGDAATVIEDETRKLTKQIMSFTGQPGLGQDAQKLGEKAIERDLMKIFTPVNSDFLDLVGSEFGVSGIDAWFTNPGTGNRYELKWDRIDPSGNGMAAFHEKNRNRRGRTRSLKRKGGTGKWYSPYVVRMEDYRAYLQKQLLKVGWKKASWGKAFVMLGGKGLPKWISRHIPNHPSDCRIELSGNSPSITIYAKAPNIGDDAATVRDALRSRSETIARRVKLILSGYSKDMKQGMIISRKETRSNTD